MSQPYLLSLDIGTSSIGYVVFAVDAESQPTRVLDLGVRIFSDGRDPQTKEPLAVGRRGKRSLRRNRDRGQNRVRRLARELVQFGLLPADEGERKQVFDTISPYEARVQAVHGTVEAYTLGRALLHLGRRRGFKSNRLAGDEEETDFKDKIARLRDKLGNGTLGEYLLARVRENEELKRQKRPQDQQVVRFRSGETELYTDRQMYEYEFARIQEVQGDALLSSEQWEALRETVFWQYPLKPVPKGRCRFYSEEDRAHADLPITHRYRIATEVNALRYESQGEQHELDVRQRQMLYEHLDRCKTATFKSLLKKRDEHKSPYFPPDAVFNLDVGSRSGKLLGNHVMCDLRKPEYLGELADRLDSKRLNDVIEYLIEPTKIRKDRIVVLETKELEDWLREELPGLTEKQIHNLCRYRFKRDTASVSRKFMTQVVPVLHGTGLVYDKAVKKLGEDLGIDLHHSDFRTGEFHWRLPYYGQVMPESVWGKEPEADKGKASTERDEDAYQYGKIANPTVHIALNQLRVVVNRVIDNMGEPPTRIHVELTRDLKNSREARKKIEQQQTKNKKDNDRIRKMLEEEHHFSRVSREDLQKIKLWEELGKQGMRFCVFSGKPISASQLFNGEVEIEHIIPFSRCYDDGMGNKTLAFKSVNNRKGNRTPFEAFGGTSEYSAIMKRALASFGQGSKYNRFKEGAFEAFYGQEKGGDMIARQLNDTRYISSKARQYLSCVTGSIDAVVPVNGRMTAVLRNVWQLNRFKDRESGHYRDDHRHHIVDAFVVGLTSRSLIKQLSTRRSGREQTEEDLYHFIKNRVDDIPTLRAQLNEKLDQVIVSYKPDHTKTGSMFNDTAYGIEHDEDGNQWCITRKAVEALSHDEIFLIRGQRVKQQLLAFLTGNRNVGNKKELKVCLPNKKDLAEKAKAFTVKTGIKKVRISIPNNSVKPIPSAPYKGYAKNSYAYCDVWQIPKRRSKETGEWLYEYKGAFVAYAEVKDYEQYPKRPVDRYGHSHPAAKRLMRLYKDDCVRLTDKVTGEQRIMRVAGYEVGGSRLDIQPALQAGISKQNYKSINGIFSKHVVNKIRA